MRAENKQKSKSAFNDVQRKEIAVLVQQGVDGFFQKNYEEFALLRNIVKIPKTAEAIKEFTTEKAKELNGDCANMNSVRILEHKVQ